MPGLNYSNSLWDGKTGLWDGNTGLWCGVSGLALVSESLFLNFLTGSLDPRITFSRGSQATLTDSTGKITYAPNNLLTNSESFEASAWTKTAATITANSAVAPDGTTTADTITEDTTAASSHRVFQSITFVAASYTASVYVKAGTRSWFYIRLTDSGSAQRYAYFNVSTGALGTVETNLTASITSVGNGWYRCSATVNAALAGSNAIVLAITDANGNPVYNGNGTGSLYLWGAQLEQVTYQTTPGTYNSTTPKNLLGYTQEFDNAAWTKSNAFVQTNLVQQSEAFDNAYWNKASATVTSNAIMAPNGTMTADLVTATAASGYVFPASGIFAAAGGSTYTYSVYAKAGTSSTVQLLAAAASNYTATYNLSTQVVSGVSANATASMVSVGDGWFRLILTCNNVANNAYTEIQNGRIASGTTIYLWGAQLVQGATAGDYQPTYAAAAAVQYPAPDNSLTADKLVENTANAKHQISNTTAVTVVLGQIVTFSFYAKAAERSRVYVECSTGIFGANITQFNLTGSGSVISGQGTITDVGGGWYRCSSVLTATAGGSAVCYIITGDGSSSTYTGDGTSGIYIWGAQLSNSASLDPYVYNPGAAPTSAAYYGPRFDCDPVTLAAKGLLIEEQRTNLLTYSNDWSNAAWSKTNITVTAASTMSPDGSVNAQKLAATAAASTSITAGVVVAATSATYTLYVKQGTGATTANTFGIRNATSATNLVFFTFNYATGAIAYSVGTTGASATAVGNGWWRIQISVTTGITSGDSLIVYVGWSGGGAAAGDFLYAYGAQLEAGAFATSYIPTVASQVTRSADVATMTGANFSNWYNQNEGSFAIAVDSATTGYRTNLQVDDGTLNNRILIQTNNVATAQQYYVVVGGSAVVNTAAQPYSSAGSKTSATYKLNDYAYSVNGTAVTTDTSATVPAVNRMFLGTEVSSNFLNGHIRSITYYNTRLANATLQALTV